jgi:hypothetical protein
MDVRVTSMLTLKHLQCSLGEPDEDAVVDLQQTQELQCLALLRVNLVDTLDAHHKRKLGLPGNVKAFALLGLAGEANPLPVCIAIFLHIFLGPCKDYFALLLALCC